MNHHQSYYNSYFSSSGVSCYCCFWWMLLWSLQLLLSASQQQLLLLQPVLASVRTTHSSSSSRFAAAIAFRGALTLSKRSQLSPLLFKARYNNNNKLSPFCSDQHRSSVAVVTREVTTTMIMSSAGHYNINNDVNSEASKIPSSQAASTKTTPALRLIDVDCNLWHADLPLLLSLLPPQQQQQQLSQVPTNDEDHDHDSTNNVTAVPECFRILQRDNVNDIAAVLSPSSTITEAATGIAALHELQRFTAAAAATATTSSQQHNVFPNIRIRTTVGVHPYHVNDPELRLQDAVVSIADHMEVAKRLILQDQQQQQEQYVAAVGECGLDGSDGFPPIAEQRPWFRAQIALARELQLPLFVHERKAFDATMEELLPADIGNNNNNVPVIIHCFTGTVDECRAYIARGYFISISGYIFRDEAGAVRQCLEDGIIPLDKLMIETDAPYLGFAGCRDLFVAQNFPAAANVSMLNAKQRKNLVASKYPNAPSALTAVLAKVLHHVNVGRAARGGGGDASTLLLLDLPQLALHTSRNANAFFGFGLDV